ncbi:MAG: DUF721 domain-containing protein [Candidatus Margulisiibacteriota bacterium]
METLKMVLEEFIKKNPRVGKKLKGYEAVSLWPQIIDKEDRSWVEEFSSGILTVATENPSYCQELSFDRKRIVKALNNRIGEHAVKDIKVKIGGRTSGKTF